MMGSDASGSAAVPVVLGVGKVCANLMAAPGPGLKCRTALRVSCGAGNRSPDACNRTTGDIDSDRGLIPVEQSQGRTACSAMAP